MREYLECLWCEAAWKCRQAWTWLKYRPWLRCPTCEGTGGGCDYYGEAYECHSCYEDWSECGNVGLHWTEGRISLTGWIYAKLELKTGQRSFRGAILCRLGFHKRSDHPYLDGFCERCLDELDGHYYEQGRAGEE